MIATIGFVLLVLVLVFPPWVDRYLHKDDFLRLGTWPIYNPPDGASVDVALLVVRVVAVIVLFAGLLYATRPKRQL
ncbi:MAG: hypothetical protein AB1752_04300 [Candidatus Zixiibacteriota bacterium]